MSNVFAVGDLIQTPEGLYGVVEEIGMFVHVNIPGKGGLGLGPETLARTRKADLTSILAQLNRTRGR